MAECMLSSLRCFRFLGVLLDDKTAGAEHECGLPLPRPFLDMFSLHGIFGPHSIACVSATGHAIPLFVIFDAKSLNYEWTRGQVPGTRYGLSSTGWVDKELFKWWLNKHFLKHFLKHAVGSRSLLLVLEGHSTH